VTVPANTEITIEPQAPAAGSTAVEAAQDARTATKSAQSATSGKQRAKAQPTADEIATEAYALYVAGGYQDGHDLEHWLEAEQLLRSPRPR
jgi:hypothetical protein